MASKEWLSIVLFIVGTSLLVFGLISIGLTGYAYRRFKPRNSNTFKAVRSHHFKIGNINELSLNDYINTRANIKIKIDLYESRRQENINNMKGLDSKSPVYISERNNAMINLEKTMNQRQRLKEIQGWADTQLERFNVDNLDSKSVFINTNTKDGIIKTNKRVSFQMEKSQ